VYQVKSDRCGLVWAVVWRFGLGCVVCGVPGETLKEYEVIRVAYYVVLAAMWPVGFLYPLLVDRFVFFFYM
jgi:hypothetical protein